MARALTALFAQARAPRWQWAALAVGCPATAALLAFGADRRAVPLPPVRSLPPGTAVTDRGRDVHLGEPAGGPWPVESLWAAEARQLREYGLAGRVIQVAPADWSYNCHGWVFTGGHYLLPDGDVEPILRDNGYTPVEQPAVGDVAVYRDERGDVCHTGRVWAVGEGGQVLLESKWAYMGRYLHPPDATPLRAALDVLPQPPPGPPAPRPGGPAAGRHPGPALSLTAFSSRGPVESG